MIACGGYNGLVSLDTGGRYDPRTDSWVATNNTNAPARRDLHTAVWTGSEMFVWGGENGPFNEIYLNTGGRYNPSTDIWTNITTTNVPEARRNHTAVWTGSEMIVWGGYNGSYLNSGGRYDPTSESWTATSTTDAPAARDSQTAVWTGNEM